ncbi:recQ-mediated genome instability protein 1-like isoform X2 [Solanum pennellii]|uniref:RecQ-mediated genome instability protein 1 n=1 Tax=Solanum pennellii TaxID=28526 RepID=A0ABM1VBN6_SOLPN|nr:recQ-mediated genome instability protein 1-like isoform X2 [Solanum pennellii]
MNRRRHQIICSSDEEDGDDEPQQFAGGNEENENPNNIEIEILESSTNFQSVTLNSPIQNPTPNREPNVDVSEVVRAADCGIGRALEGLGLRLRREWLESCVGGLEGSVVGEFSGLDDTTKAKLCFEQFLYSDMNSCGAGMLPRDVHKLHLVDLKGPFVLQKRSKRQLVRRGSFVFLGLKIKVHSLNFFHNSCLLKPFWKDEIVNISCPLRDRYQNVAAGIKRCLKLSMTDGIQRVFGMEYRPIKDLNVLAPSGLKVAICNVHVRHGILMLVPEVIEVLGGMVEELEEARKRLVNEINKPPRGKRTRSGVVPPLATRATAAAWPREGVTVPEHSDTSSRQNMHFQVHERGTSGIATTATEEIHPVTSGLPSSTSFTTPVYRREAQSNFPSTPAVSVPFNRNTGPTFSSDAASHAEDIHMADMTTEGIDVPIRREHNDPVLSSSSSMEVEELLSDVRSDPATPASSRSRGSVRVSSDSFHYEDVTPDTLSTAAIDVDEIDLVDELDHPYILSGAKENPFTYLASLSAKQAGMHGSASTATGKIKCFLTGVKGFQYKQSSKYELRVYVDDGSLISEILIDHAEKIGFSPAEVNAALSSSDSKRVSDTKETLKCFQKFLINFEGTMLVHLNEESPIPVATEMNQGCSASDAWLLLKRLKPSTSPRQHHLHHSETINLSP